MSRARLLTWGLGLMIATPALARQWTDPAAKPAPAPAMPQPLPVAVPPAAKPNTSEIQPTSATNSGFRSVPMPVAPEPVAPAPARLPTPDAAPAKPTSSRPQSQPAAPSVIIEKRCPETVNVGTPLVYEIIVRNVGVSAVTNVRIDDELPAGAKYMGGDPPAEPAGDRMAWSLGSMEPNAERIVRVEVQPSIEGEFRSIAHVSFSAASTMRTQVVCPKLAVAMVGPENALTGDPVPFQIQISNPGTGPVQNLAVRVKLPTTLQHPNGTYIEAELGALAPGETRMVPLKTIAGPGGLATAEVSATGDGVAEASAKADVQLMQPQLQLRRTGPAKILFKGEAAEELEISNPGNAPAGNVTVVEMLPAGMEFVGASDGGTYDPASRAVTWKLGQAPAGARRTIALKAKCMSVGDQTTHVVASADRGLESRAEGVIAVEGIPALALELVDLEDPVEINGELMYEVRVFNQGSCACTNIQIQALAPDGLTPAEGTGPTACKISGQQIVFEPVSKLATKADAVFRIKVRGTQPGDYRFKVSMTCDQLKTPVNKEEASRVYKN